MVKKTLEKKLKRVCFWIIGGAFLYAALSYFLLNNYSFQHSPLTSQNAYDLLKDTLTISAYFLAPGIAWALVTDWKEQHQAIEQYNFFNEMDFQLHELYRISEDFYLEITQRTKVVDSLEEQWRNEVFKIFGEVNKVNNKYRSIEIQNSNAFMKQAEELIGAFNSVCIQFHFVLADYFALLTSDKANNDGLKFTFEKSVESLSKNLNQIKANLIHLKTLKPDL